MYKRKIVNYFSPSEPGDFDIDTIIDRLTEEEKKDLATIFENGEEDKKNDAVCDECSGAVAS